MEKWDGEDGAEEGSVKDSWDQDSDDEAPKVPEDRIPEKSAPEKSQKGSKKSLKNICKR